MWLTSLSGQCYHFCCCGISHCLSRFCYDGANFTVVALSLIADHDDFNRLLSDTIHRHILDPAILPTALRNLRGALFPNNAMGTQTLFPPESDQELRALRRKCASALWALVPQGVGKLYFGGSGSSWLAAWFSKSVSSVSPGPPRSVPIGGHDSGGTGDGLDEGLDERIIAEIENDILDVFSDPYCNKHLMYSALELVLVRLMPELAEKGVVELWEERLS